MSTPQPTVVVYGATGYTGKLVVAELAARSVPLVLAGRSAERLRAVAATLPDGVEAIVEAPIDDHAALQGAAGRGSVVVNCAGPFARTGTAVLRAAAAAGAHYVDTTGEQDWIARVLGEHDAELRAADVAAVPGMGFDYLPGDLLCNVVGAPLGPLRRLDVAYHVEGFGMTRGTQRSALEMLDGRDVVYEDGALKPGGTKPLRASVEFPAPIGRRTVGRYPAGEVVTAPKHLDVRTIAARISTVSIAPGPAAPLVPYATPVVARLLRTPLKGLIDRAIERLPEGPPEDERRAVRWTILVTATAEDGGSSTGVVRGPDIYGLTARTISDAAQALGSGAVTARGGLAPAQAFDARRTLDALADFGVTYEVDGVAGAATAATAGAATTTSRGVSA
ncbi:trans-acting enoyl reductase family protein [Patulibacter sp.]|uniref:saccharopine dehydrogenase family protein n=1 Tax=Patulibacter sp. TaxID=1912859 RepID=UPI00271D1F6F|nr:saccharopine dehydrogenase NADP-binding domain-containing protein [Patulibacter sp.]MDO9410568.1 saccharopine dehydrogenase NADP-binding domain-containing protein [Patulibacter sp.]